MAACPAGWPPGYAQAQLSKNADVVKKLTTDLEAAKKATNGNAAEVKAKLDKENAAMMKLKADVEAFKVGWAGGFELPIVGWGSAGARARRLVWRGHC